MVSPSQRIPQSLVPLRSASPDRVDLRSRGIRGTSLIYVSHDDRKPRLGAADESIIRRRSVRRLEYEGSAINGEWQVSGQELQVRIGGRPIPPSSPAPAVRRTLGAD